MTWQIATFALLAVVLAGGFVWYERSRPSARLLGLVAALAALAAAGRVALSPVPNVTPTTDIALLSGYSLGAPAGFVVGALAAVVSNFWLGQGPWTPWQMGAWGLAGLAGAALARVGHRRLGRAGLALACAAMALIYGALLDLSVMVTYGGEQSLDRYLALSARALPFNVAHAVGNAAFALAAGPAFVRILTRFRSRLEFEWREPEQPRSGRLAGAGAIPALVLALALAGTLAAAPAQAGVPDARRYLERVQNRDGGLPVSPGGDSSVAITGWAMLGLEAGGRNPIDLRRRGKSPVDFLRKSAGSIRSTGDLERTILALDAAGIEPRSFGGRDLVGELGRRRSSNGSFQGQVNLTAFGVLALRATGASRSALRRSASWLRRAQNGDGGWGFQPGSRSDADSTGASLQALAAAGNRGGASSDGARYLRRTQRRDGGWALALGGPTNAQSTAWAVQGLVAAGASPAVAKGSRTAFDYLAARQSADGHFRYSAASDQTPVWVTGQALLAVARKAFPLATVPRATAPGGVPLPASSRGRGDGAGAGGDGGGEKGERGGGRAARDGRGEGEGAGATRAEAGGGAAPEPVAAAAGELGTDAYEAAAKEDELGTATVVLGGLAVLALALTAGFFVYRRRLP